jgi:hypothetical protein
LPGYEEKADVGRLQYRTAYDTGFRRQDRRPAIKPSDGHSCIGWSTTLSWFPLISGGARKAYKYLETKFPNAVPDQEECMKGVHHAIEAKLGHKVILRYGETTFCKCGRSWYNVDGQFWDLVDPRFPLFSVKQKGIILMYRNGTQRTIHQFFDISEGKVTTEVECNTNCPRREWMKLFI